MSGIESQPGLTHAGDVEGCQLGLSTFRTYPLERCDQDSSCMTHMLLACSTLSEDPVETLHVNQGGGVVDHRVVTIFQPPLTAEHTCIRL